MPTPLFPRRAAGGERLSGKRRPSSTAESPNVKRKKAEDQSHGETPRATSRTFRYPIGTKVLGIISSVCRDRLLVDLPCGQSGYVLTKDAIHEDSEETLATSWSRGMYVICQRIEADGEKSSALLRLTLLPRVLNTDLVWPPVKNQILVVRVTSTEEHGFNGSLDSANHNARVFVKTNEVPTRIKPGNIEYVTVEAVKKEAKLLVCRHGTDSKLRYIAFNADFDKGSLLAGQLVECTVSAVSSLTSSSSKDNTLLPAKGKHAVAKCFPHGVAALDVTIAKSIGGMIPRLHLHHPLSRIKGGESNSVWPFKVAANATSNSIPKGVEKRLATWPLHCPRFGISDRFLGRVIAVIPGATSTAASSTIVVSALAHVVHLDNDSLLEAMLPVRSGSKLVDARVAEVEMTMGVRAFAATIDTPLAGDATDPQLQEWKMHFAHSVLVHCAKEKVANEGIEAKLLKLSIGQKHDMRALSVNYVDGVVSAGMSKELLEEPYAGFANVDIGAIVKGKVVKSLENGLLVELSTYLKGRVANEQISDLALSEVPASYKEGTVHKFRVLHLDTGRCLISLTAKKSFINLSEEQLSKHVEMSKIDLNDILDTFVASSMPFGLIVRGFGDFSAVLPFVDIVSTLEGREIADSSLISDAAISKILSMKRYKTGASLRVRVSKIASRPGQIKPNISVSVDLDKVSAAVVSKEDEVSMAEKRSNPDSGVPPFIERQRITATLPWTVSEDDTVEGIAERALNKLGGVGAVVDGRVQSKDIKRNGISVALWGRLRAWIHVTELVDHLSSKEDPMDDIVLGDMITVRLTGFAPADMLPHTTEICRQDGVGDLILLEGSKRSTEAPPLPQSVKDLTVGKEYVGVVRSASLKGVYVYLSSRCYVRVKVKELAGRKVQKHLAAGKTLWDEEILKQFYPPGKIVGNVRIVGVALGKNQAEGSLKRDLLSELVGRKGQVTFDNVSEGDKLVAKVKRVESFGVFVTLHNSEGLDALCVNSEIVDTGVALDQKLEPGDHVVVKVLKKDEQRRRINVGMKTSYFSDLDIAKAVEKAEVEVDAPEPGKGSEKTLEMLSESEDDESGSTASFGDAETLPAPEAAKVEEASSDLEDKTSAESEDEESTVVEKLSSMNSRDWLGAVEKAESSDDDVMKRVKDQLKSRKDNRAPKAVPSADVDLEKEQSIREIERRNAEGQWENEPKSVDDFERILLVSGGNATAWISYMAYHVKLQDLEEARKIAKRGIASVEGEEKTKVWIALLNLELNFGDNVESTLEDALVYNSPKSIYFHMIEAYETRGDWRALDTLADRMLKKLSADPTVWVRYLASLYMRDWNTARIAAPLGNHNSQVTKISATTRARIDEILNKALHRLDKSNHLELQTTLARFEFKFGSSERGRTSFLKILAEKPKRTDIWNLLFDAQIASLKRQPSKTEISAARHLFWEVIKVSLKPTKMKPMFARWQSFEKVYGDEKSLDQCRQAAKAYVQSVMQ